MLTLIHGDNTEASRRELNRIRTGYREIRMLSGKALTSRDLIQAADSGSLFGGKSAVVIENFLTKNPAKSKLTAELLDFLVRVAERSDIILWEEKEIPKSTVSRLSPKLTERLIKHPPALFAFLDALAPGKPNALLVSYGRVLEKEASELVHAMILRRIRQLIMIKDGIKPRETASWQENRLTMQAKLFTMEQLIRLHKSLTMNEFSVKSGATPLSIRELTELTLADPHLGGAYDQSNP
ncbi:hypothetical protein A2Z33_05265 [Candidatus Gottesmanbacteria bacterium RBG_16_52_11]|uniref:DNA polymerase III delta N-terminal domain-containing protein n=1 Tax=Candidatus Gottesmanbacteria bacterium RBG_16_52_11 TaxID=1798374 RepID=A0A1F5YQI0_9BACT|nr:MAG: hypothetical protein A2Z33_05265 [Candidatus Gottesmanbacteria bacterium RBG_16_52_11]